MITTQIREMEAARQTTVGMVVRLRGEMTDRDRRMQEWYRDRGAIEVWAQCAAWCVTWSMIGAAMNAMNAAVAELDEAMGTIVGGWEVPRLTNKAAFEAFEEQEQLQAPGSPRLILAHEQNDLRRMVDQE